MRIAGVRPKSGISADFLCFPERESALGLQTGGSESRGAEATRTGASRHSRGQRCCAGPNRRCSVYGPQLKAQRPAEPCGRAFARTSARRLWPTGLRRFPVATSRTACRLRSRTAGSANQTLGQPEVRFLATLRVKFEHGHDLATDQHGKGEAATNPGLTGGARAQESALALQITEPPRGFPSRFPPRTLREESLRPASRSRRGGSDGLPSARYEINARRSRRRRR